MSNTSTTSSKSSESEKQSVILYLKGLPPATYSKIALSFYSAVAIAAAIIHLTSLGIGSRVDPVFIGLLVIAIIPWLPEIIDTLDVAGVFKFSARREVKELRQEVDRQQRLVNFLVTNRLGAWVYVHLHTVAQRQLEGHGEYLFQQNDENMRRDLQLLMGLGLIELFDTHAFPDDGKRDLVKDIKITKAGVIYLFLDKKPVLIPPEVQAELKGITDLQ